MARAACRILLSRGSDLSHLRHWTPGRGRILRRESLSRRLRGAGRTPGLWLAWQFGGPHHGIPATGACRSFLSHSATVSELFGRHSSVPGCLSGGMGEPRLASACGSLRFAVSYRARASPGVCLFPVWWIRRHVGPREACPSGHVDRAPRGDAGGVTELVSSPQRSIAFGMRGDFAPHPPLIAIVFRTHVMGRSLRGGVFWSKLRRLFRAMFGVVPCQHA